MKIHMTYRLILLTFIGALSVLNRAYAEQALSSKEIEPDIESSSESLENRDNKMSMGMGMHMGEGGMGMHMEEGGMGQDGMSMGGMGMMMTPEQRERHHQMMMKMSPEQRERRQALMMEHHKKMMGNGMMLEQHQGMMMDPEQRERHQEMMMEHRRRMMGFPDGEADQKLEEKILAENKP